MQQRFRLTESRRFSQIHQEGRSAANGLLVIRVLPNGSEQSRFGFAVSKRIGNAVTRNQVKRRLREVIRRSQVEAGWDAVFIARRGAEEAGYWQLKRAIDNLLRRTHLLVNDPRQE